MTPPLPVLKYVGLFAGRIKIMHSIGNVCFSSAETGVGSEKRHLPLNRYKQIHMIYVSRTRGIQMEKNMFF